MVVQRHIGPVNTLLGTFSFSSRLLYPIQLRTPATDMAIADDAFLAAAVVAIRRMPISTKPRQWQQ
tara:strand:- start:147 stop:344 length:198 start_codon:yes stop_codon:yes gene_type:complete